MKLIKIKTEEGRYRVYMKKSPVTVFSRWKKTLDTDQEQTFYNYLDVVSNQ
jgi:hypothetical protein